MNQDIEHQLKLAMRGLAQSVVIITTAQSGERHAMAATAVCPVSMDPPSMLFCINRTASAHPILSKGAAFCINLLADRHEDLARLCSGPTKGEARFGSGAFATDDEGVPYVLDAQANVTCVQDGRVSYGTHDVFFGKVRSVRVAGAIEPLIYLDGSYVAVAR
jgi:flavin reductase (DIM6/NTAB) family NADH-FMN oxidoreductase RutF